MSDSETSRHVTVYQQLKVTENFEEGDRFVVHGEYYGDRHTFDEDLGDFVPIARAVAVIDVGIQITDDEVSEWCKSYAGKAALAPLFPELEPDDPALPDSEEYLEADADA